MWKVTKQWEHRIAMQGPGALNTKQVEMVRRWQGRKSQFHCWEAGFQDRTTGLQGGAKTAVFLRYGIGPELLVDLVFLISWDVLADKMWN